MTLNFILQKNHHNHEGFYGKRILRQNDYFVEESFCPLVVAALRYYCSTTPLWLMIWFYLLLTGCTTSYFVLDIIDLPPPQNVRAERRGEQIVINWQPGRERRRATLAGYKLFTARHSLATTPVHELPPPILLSATDTTFILAPADSAKLFLHIRSYLDRHKISLPSLPEVIVPGMATK